MILVTDSSYRAGNMQGNVCTLLHWWIEVPHVCPYCHAAVHFLATQMPRETVSTLIT